MKRTTCAGVSVSIPIDVLATLAAEAKVVERSVNSLIVEIVTLVIEGKIGNWEEAMKELRKTQ